MDTADISKLGEVEQKILQYLQYEFPLTPHPYTKLANDLGITEAEVLSLVKKLKMGGYIRRFGASINSRKLGYKSTLVALIVAEDRLSAVTAVINSLPGVTHNYLRDGEYNVWFTLITPDEQVMADQLDMIKSTQGVTACLSLPAKRIFKLNVKFPMITG